MTEELIFGIETRGRRPLRKGEGKQNHNARKVTPKSHWTLEVTLKRTETVLTVLQKLMDSKHTPEVCKKIMQLQ